jgi:hypothetical protein
MGKVFGTCANCHGAMIGGKQDGDLQFCCEACLKYYKHPGFCDSCVAQTSPEQMSGTFAYNFIFGTRLHGWGERCKQCNSIVKRKWFWFFLPLFPVSAKYRLIYSAPRRYHSRKIKYDLG